MLTIDSIMARYKKCKRYAITAETDEYFHYIDSIPFYVSPSFTPIKMEEKLSESNPRMILFSAPGATGKSSLAKYIAAKYQGIYWDSSKMRLGTNSFSGTIIKSVSHQNYSSFVDDLCKSNSILVIDALDEAEIISGHEMVLEFIGEINSTLGERTTESNPSVFLLTRTETAEAIVKYCVKSNIHLIHYQIEFFEEYAAKKFINDKINKRGNSVINECIDNYYAAISRKIKGEDVKSFLGYAPVLEAIAAHIQEFKNPQKLLNELKSETDSIEIIIQILEDLLLREQNDKVVPAFLSKINDETVKNNDLYSPDEQLFRLMYYIIFGDAKFENYPIEGLKEEYLSKYQEVLDAYLCQHPFIRRDVESKNQVSFTGPAFRDYVLAKLLTSRNSDAGNVVETYFDAFCDIASYMPSQMFFDCYMKMSDNNVAARDKEWLFHAFRAKTSAYQNSFVHIEETGRTEAGDVHHCDLQFIIQDSKKNKELVIDACMQIKGDRLQFHNVCYSHIDLPNMIIDIGTNRAVSEILCSTVIAKKIVWGAETIKIKNFSPYNSSIVSYEDMEKIPLHFDVENSGHLMFDAPNIKGYYTLLRYAGDFTNPLNNNVSAFAHAIYTILREFRSHGKDTLAKDADKINNVVIGKNEEKKYILEYLIYRSVIYENDHLYKIDLDSMKKIGLNNIVIYAKQDVLSGLYSDFLSWKDSKTI